MFLPNFERSSVQSGQEGVDDGPGEANSDSGDSLFITQKDVPEAVRSGRRRHTNLRSDSKLQHEDLAELVPDSSSSSEEEPETARKGNKNCYKVPKFKFSFLNEDNKSKPIINNVKNAKFQTCAMASFIISVRELWRSFELGGDLAASLPTIDTDGEALSSMSEGEETSEGEDIKVVERKCFVTPLRKTRSQSWNSSDKRSSENKIQKKALKDSQKEEAKGTDRRSQNMLSKEFLSSATESSDDETVVSRKNEASAADIFAQIGRLTEESLITNSSHATACEPRPEKHIRRDQEVRIAPTEPNCEDFHTDGQSKSERAECGLENQNPSSIDIHNDTLCRKSRVKKRKKKKDREDEEHNQKETDDQHYLVDITKEEHLSQQVDTPVLKWKEKKKTKDTTPEEEEVRHRQSEEEVEDDSVEDRKWTVSKKTKKKKEKSAEDVGQGQPEEQKEDDSVEKLTVFKKTKKRKEKFSKEDEVGQEQPEEQAEDNHVEEWTISKKTKKKKEKSAEEEEVGPGLLEEQVEDDSVDNSKWTISKKSKKKKEKSAEEEEGGQGQPEEQVEDRPVEKWTISKKMKKKEKSAEEDEFGQGQPEEEVKNDSVDDSKWTISKKTKKKNEKFSEEDEFGQGQPEEQVADNPVERLTVFKKKKKKKDKFSKEDEVGQEQPEEQAVDNPVEKWTVSKKTKRRNFVEGNIAAETSGVGSTKKKKKKHLDPDVPQTSPGHHKETGKHLENTEVSLETTESRSTKRKKKKEPTSTDDPLIAGDDDDDDAVTMETGLNLTATKISISATEDISHKADNSQKKKERAELKKKKKMRGSSSAVICEETITPPGDSVLVQIKKEKTSSFLAADEEEKSRKKHKQQHGPSPSAAPPDVGTEALTATSADATEGYSESKDGGKRRRGLLLQSVWKEKQNLRNWRMHLKKKKRKRNNIEAMSSTEKVESLADVENSQTEEAVVKKRKKKKRNKNAEETRETG